MTSSRARAAVAFVGCLAGGALAFSPPGFALAAGHHAPSGSHAAAKINRSHGLFVVNRNGVSQKVENYGTDSAMVRDPSGREHIVTTKASKTNPNKGHVVYLTRQNDRSVFRARAIPQTIPLNGGVQVEAQLSNNGRRVFAVIYRCDGIYVSDAPVGAARLSVPSQVKPLDECAAPPAHSNNPPLAHAGTLYGREVSILIEDENLGSPVWSIYRGVPGGTFSAGTPLPTVDNFTPQQIATDPRYGRLVVVGTGTDGTNQGIYETFQNRFSDAWSEPVLVATLNSATTDFRIDAVQTNARHTYIGLQKPTAGGKVVHRLYLVKGQPTGQWLGAIPLAHSSGNDTNLRLVVNTATNHLHAVWTRISSRHGHRSGGLMHEAQSAHGWGRPVYLTRNFHDVATQITLTRTYRPVVGYVQ